MQIPSGPEFYYLANFLTAMDWISSRYDDLLDEQERQFITDFRTLALPAQALLVRLVMRKGPHFRRSKLSYAEIGDIDAAAEPLLELGWISTQAPLTITETLALLRRDEAAICFAEIAPLRSAAKNVMYQLLADACPGAQSFTDWCPALNDVLFTLVVSDLCDRLRLIFFGNLRQTWSEFVLADLGIFRYEQVSISRESRGFGCRTDVEQYLHIHRCREDVESQMPIEQVLERLGTLECANPYVRNRYAKLLFAMARQLERAGESCLALELYERSRYSGARQRRVRILEKCERYGEAYALAREALADPESDTEQQLVERALHRVARKLGVSTTQIPKRLAENRIDLSLPGPAPFTVELLVRDHLARPDAPVHYVENALISSLFGLLCWEAIFAPLPGAFFHPFHNAPVDLHSPDFRHRRADLFDACLGQLDSDAYKDSIWRTWEAKYGIQSPFVFWGALSPELLEQALACLPAAHLRIWMERLLCDVRANRAGMPDLIQFWPAEQRYRMIEVKGPGDRLQDNQRRWLALCAQHDMPVDVCYVQWASA
ncbi:VRR-NUC domain-containing protein [Pseudomonas sp. gcc21]|uniref:VRR-NUC domain-containing protein n=1 Tax=Pseudomonas sp. gcc21 TaxID=2726989 RepID=UPI001451CBDA|nr:VRR-NUC domain-containing protein [Pseudomonas sp. gcc21]QJD57902.1 VRR-NUC domain-containing protein [Pseudomonas sp. gcc21]